MPRSGLLSSCYLLDDASRTLLEAGSSTIIGIVEADGGPCATRGWGSVVVDDEPLRVRVLVGAGQLRAMGHQPGATDPFAIAITGCDVRTLRSIQLKGTVVAIEEICDEDRGVSAAFCDDFFAAVEEVDHIERWLMERLVPADLWACICEIDEVFDQTPGPGAGARMGT